MTVKHLIYLGISTLIVHIATAQPDGPETRSIAPELLAQASYLSSGYLLYQPQTDGETAELLPLVIHLHGGGGHGADLQKIKWQSMQLWQGFGAFNTEPCMLVAPQCLPLGRDGSRGTWEPHDLNLFLQDLCVTLPVDRRKIYLTGNSMGGYGTWAWGAHNPEHFAGIAPMVGGIGRGGPKDVTPDIQVWASNLAQVPVYAFVGAQDQIVPAERSQRMIEAIRKAGGTQARLKIYPEAGHDAPRLAYADPEFYEWLFAQERD